MSAPVLRVCVGFPLAFAACNLTVAIFPSQQCPPRQLVVEIPPDPESTPSTYEHEFHSAAGCTILFDVRRYRISPVFEEPRWDPIGGLDYELRVEPYRAPHGENELPAGRLEIGRLPADGRLIVPTEPGHTAVWLTVFVPDARLNKIDEEIAVVFLD